MCSAIVAVNFFSNLAEYLTNKLFIMYQLLESKIEQSKSFDFGDVLSRSIDLFKKVWVEGFVHLLIMMVISLPVIVLTYITMFVMFGANYFLASGGNPDYMQNQDFDPVMIPSMVGFGLLILLVSAIMQTFNISIMAHFYQVCKSKDLGTPLPQGGYFSYLKNGNFKKLLVLSFATMGIAVLAVLLCYIPLFYVIVPLTLLLVIYTFNPELTVKELLKASFKLGNKYWLMTFLLLLVSGFIAYLGVLACGIGMFFTAMFARLPLYYIYKDTIGFDELEVKQIE